MDRYFVPLGNGRSLSLAGDQCRRIARGLGELDAARDGASEPPIVAAIRALPLAQRADAWTVALLRFAGKQDVETISQTSGLSPWRVWQLEEAVRQALSETRAAPQPTLVGSFAH